MSKLTHEEIATDILRIAQAKLDKAREDHAVASDRVHRLITLPAMRMLVGSCYRYHNCYSGPSARWWLYARIVGVESPSTFKMFTFQMDCNGNLEAKTEEAHVYTGKLTDGYEPITDRKFEAEWAKFQKSMAIRSKPSPKGRRK